MSTIVVVRKDGQAAIAADSLTTGGSEKESARYIRNHHKIIRVGQSYLAICGPTSANFAIRDYFSDKQEVDLANVDAIFRAWIGLHGILKNRYFVNPDEDAGEAYQSSRMEVLIANRHGIFGVDAHRAVREFTTYYTYGSGSHLARGAMFVAYQRSGLSAEEIAKTAIEAAADFDTSTGLPIISFALELDS
jgi:ATP-dependent protease HslVU (ClpYQ) peptidase subunit